MELRSYLLLAAAFFASLVPPLVMLCMLQREQWHAGRRLRTEWHAGRRLRTAGAQDHTEVFEGSSSSSHGLPKHEPSADCAPSRARKHHLQTCSSSDLHARPGTRLLQRPTQASATSGPLHKQLYAPGSASSNRNWTSSREPSLHSHNRPSQDRPGRTLTQDGRAMQRGLLIGDVGYDSSQGPAPAIGTNRRELMLYQFVLI